MSTDFDRIPMRITTHLLDNRTQKSQVILGIDCVKWLLIWESASIKIIFSYNLLSN